MRNVKSVRKPPTTDCLVVCHAEPTSCGTEGVSRSVAVQVEFESKLWKPVSNDVGLKVETRYFQAMGLVPPHRSHDCVRFATPWCVSDARGAAGRVRQKKKGGERLLRHRPARHPIGIVFYGTEGRERARTCRDSPSRDLKSGKAKFPPHVTRQHAATATHSSDAARGGAIVGCDERGRAVESEALC
jgi:hypothetical protein